MKIISEVKICDDGAKRWYINDKLHRLDGPAVEWSDGSKEWYVDDKRHRLDGPAIEWNDGEKWWYLNNIKYTKEEFDQELIKIKLKRLISL